MVNATDSILSAFENLSRTEQREVLAEIVSRLRRRSSSTDHEGDLSVEDLAQTADQLFVMLDEQERRNGTAETW